MFSHDLAARQDPKSEGTKKPKSRVKGKKSKGKKASFKVNGGGPGLKVGKNKEKDSLPNKGAHSYTLISPCGKGSIEVLLRHSAFFVKKISPTGSGPTGQVSFARFGGEHGAWQEATRRAGFPQ